jgi:hypothetical protein
MISGTLKGGVGAGVSAGLAGKYSWEDPPSDGIAVSTTKWAAYGPVEIDGSSISGTFKEGTVPGKLATKIGLKIPTFAGVGRSVAGSLYIYTQPNLFEHASVDQVIHDHHTPVAQLEVEFRR